MGIFNTVFVDCPKCGQRLEFQSKSGGEVDLLEFSLWNVPPEVVVGTRVEECPRCQRRWKLLLPPVQALIREIDPV